jgi:excinuclease ABC subunit A
LYFCKMLQPVTDIAQLDAKKYILIKGARVNNLKNIDIAIPRNQLVVITGLSGSGKSSLAFDTLFAEGQRMYVESLSSYARQFLGRMEKPEVDWIRGISPAIAIEQKVSTKNPRSTVGTTTEIYDYLKLLYARVGHTFSPISGKKVTKDSVATVVDYLLAQPEGSRVIISTPLVPDPGRKLETELQILVQKGFTRIVLNSEIHNIEELLAQPDTLKALLGQPAAKKNSKTDSVPAFEILIDRVVVKHNDEETQFRISDSVQTAFFEGHGSCHTEVLNVEKRSFSDKFELDGISFEQPSLNLFSFNNPYGACRRCEGFGRILGIDPDLVVPDKTLSVYEGAIYPWRSDKMSEWQVPLVKNGIKFDFPIHRAYKDLSPEQQDLLWTGNEYFKGLNQFFEYIESENYKIQYRVMLSRYRGRTTCPDCRGSRLRKDASYVKIADKSITDLVLLPISEVSSFFKNLQLDSFQHDIAKRILLEIQNRLSYMEEVGLGYLTLNRLTNTLSGGEFQRIKLATSLGSALVGSMYILDEPSIGLHPRDTQRLVGVLKTLRNMGNTVIVVEHEEEVMMAADQIIDIGPEAGTGGGQVVFQGNHQAISELPNTLSQSHTINFLKNTDHIPLPKLRRSFTATIEVQEASENNLQNISVKFPLGVLTVVTGVSGSGKSTLIRKILFPALGRLLGTHTEDVGRYGQLDGSLKKLEAVEMIDQNPIGKSSRSNPVTYIKAYDQIRLLFSEIPTAKNRGYKPAHFSFNVDGGRCETCQGEGETIVEMQFMADVHLTCESCKGQRFKQEILDVLYHGKNIADILAMTVDEALEFFRKTEPKLAEKLQPLQEVGLGYIGLGQSSNTLSGGEAQRVKLASFLGKGNTNKGKTLFIFDEPTTGLHFHDIKKLLKAINALVEQGDTVIIIEHNMEIIKCADWIIDLGPEGGHAGGQVTYQGSPENMIALKDSNHTAKFLAQKLS